MKHIFYIDRMRVYNEMVREKMSYLFSKIAEYNPVGYLVEYGLGVERESFLHTPIESVITYGLLSIPIMYLVAKAKRNIY